MPRRIVDHPERQRALREALFEHLRSLDRYQNIAIRDLRGNLWQPLVARFPILQKRDFPLDDLYAIQGGALADRPWHDAWDALGQGNRAVGAELWRAFMGGTEAAAERQQLREDSGIVPSPEFAAYRRALEATVTHTLRLQEDDGRAPWWALLALHDDVTGREGTQEYVDFRQHPPQAPSVRVSCDIDVDIDGARIVCRDRQRLSTAAPIFQRALIPEEKGTVFSDWSSLQGALTTMATTISRLFIHVDTTKRVRSNTSDVTSAPYQTAPPPGEPADYLASSARGAPKTLKQRYQDAGMQHNAPQDRQLFGEDITVLVRWYFLEQNRIPGAIEREHLRDVARLLGVLFPPPEPPGRKLPPKPRNFIRTRRN